VPIVRHQPEFVHIDGHGLCVVLVIPKVAPTVERRHYHRSSMIHPAKMSVMLCRELIRRYTKEGDLVLDPMAGIGTTLIEAALLGRNAIGVELEKKFVKITEKNIRILKKLKPDAGKAKIIQGDARELSKLLAGKVDSVVFSPPFAGTSGGKGEASRKPINERYPGLFERCIGGNKGGMSENPANIDNLPYGVDAVIFSPPFGEAQRGGGIAVKGYEGKHGKDERLHLRHDRKFSDDERNVSNLPYGVDAIVMSPPFERTLARENPNRRKGYWTGSGGYQSGRGTEGYGGTEGNIGNLPHGNIDVVITSPPYSGSNLGGGDVEAGRRRLIETGYDPRDYLGGQARNTVLDDKENIGNKKGETYLSAMKKVYEQCYSVLKPGGRMILVLKNFVRNKKIVRLDLDTRRLCEAVGFRWVETKLFRLPTRSFWRILQSRKYGDQIKNRHLLDYEIIEVFEKR
jgi:DNA modification methylase